MCLGARVVQRYVLFSRNNHLVRYREKSCEEGRKSRRVEIEADRPQPETSLGSSRC